jgi:hypothetical protein
MAASLELSAASVPAGGTSVVCTIDVQSAGPLTAPGGVDGMTVTVAGVARTVLAAALTAASKFTLYLSSPALAGEAVRVTITSSTVQNGAGNTLADVTNFVVTNGSTIAGTLDSTSFSASQMVELIQVALRDNPIGLVTVTVDGQTTTWSRTQALAELKYWQQQLATEQGRRPRASRINLSNF